MLFSTRSTSQNTPGRKPVTHSNSNVIAYLKTLSLTEKISSNANIIKKNLEIRAKKLQHFQDPDKFPAPDQDTASLITLNEEDYTKIRKNRALYDQVKRLLPDYVLEWIRTTNEGEDSLSGEENTIPAGRSSSVAGKGQLYAKPFKLFSHIPGREAPLVFPEALHAAFAHSPLPLGLFQMKHIRYIHKNLLSLDTKSFVPTTTSTSNTSKPAKVTVLNLTKICADLAVKLDDPSGLDGMEDLESFRECAQNFTIFLLEADEMFQKDDSSGDLTDKTSFFFSSHFQVHFEFFLTQTDRNTLFKW